MKSIAMKLLLALFATMGLLDVVFGEEKKPFAPNVDMETGAIIVPQD